MSTASVLSRALTGVEARQVTIEVHLSPGLPGISIVGMPETAVKESRDRVRSAIINARFNFPQQRVIINLAPADLPKEGGRFDLPIALGIFAASGQIPAAAMNDTEFIGELGLQGDLRPIRGVLPTALAVGDAGRALMVPAENAAEAALSTATLSYAADDLLSISAHLHGHSRLSENNTSPRLKVPAYPDMEDVRGQASACRALEIAAAGGHSLLLTGPPGAGKTMLASRLPGILPPMTEREAIETATIHSIAASGFQPEN